MAKHISLRGVLRGSPYEKPPLGLGADYRVLSGSDGIVIACLHCVAPCGPTRATLLAAIMDQRRHQHSQ